MPKLIVGLGNPGRQYEHTRHNAGFIAIDVLIENYGFQSEKDDFKSKLYFSQINGEKVIFAKPQTYMNLSGQAIIAIMSFYKIQMDELVVIYDDKDIPLGTFRFREQGSAGGHNGIKNIIQLLGTTSFNRIRVGIDPPAPNFKIVDWVLSKFKNEEVEKIKNSVQEFNDFVKDLTNDEDFKKIMNKYN
ncbi:peptidyl-tRNA hydrolase [Spiroplasma helicoides]|uniref:Peptidyl-tRNA hydrolase n=1 Tax=Spiroplasma helicoides TaxID=216938 RepID=A0A1B3SMC3_9MOLU|nr:aminoacyl-tRNA hydrolase [Spiroplasma helicoides]AOG61082.1 peptidyl-tRNA hydrolase [Spiroplasma helicoides]